MTGKRAQKGDWLKKTVIIVHLVILILGHSLWLSFQRHMHTHSSLSSRWISETRAVPRRLVFFTTTDWTNVLLTASKTPIHWSHHVLLSNKQTKNNQTNNTFHQNLTILSTRVLWQHVRSKPRIKGCYCFWCPVNNSIVTNKYKLHYWQTLMV